MLHSAAGLNDINKLTNAVDAVPNCRVNVMHLNGAGPLRFHLSQLTAKKMLRKGLNTTPAGAKHGVKIKRLVRQPHPAIPGAKIKERLEQ